VTNAQFRTFIEVTRYRPAEPSERRFLAHWHAGKIPAGQRAYAAWAGKQLPTEAEWPWGKEDPTRRRASQRRGTTPVGSFLEGASPYGALDMAGNVWEWCDDTDDPAFYEDGPALNPVRARRGPGAVHVMRGGSWMYGPRSLRTTSRTSFEPHYRFAGGGFRCARSLR